MAAEVIATISAGLFTGAAVYINAVEHPARMRGGVRLAVIEFDPSYHRAAWMQVPLAAIALFAGIIAWAGGSSPWWLVGAIAIGLVMPLSVMVIAPTTQRLLELAADPRLDDRLEKAGALLGRWNRLHALRSGLSVAAFVLFCVLLGS